jgi:hypothetical protein
MPPLQLEASPIIPDHTFALYTTPGLVPIEIDNRNCPNVVELPEVSDL